METTVNSKKFTSFKLSQFRTVHLYTTNNCKVYILENLADFINSSKKEKDEIVGYIIGEGIQHLFIHVNRKIYVNALEKYFKLIYVVKVPIGYHGAFQYHALFDVDSEYSYRLQYNKKYKRRRFTV
jgi:hypothetical protein